MNLLYLKYAVEVAACGSINKAAEKLYIGQPNLSRAIKELESSLGVAIFDRSAKGMEVTPDGEVFLGYAKSILAQVDEVESLFRRGAAKKLSFSLSCPRASYIGEAFASFSKLLASDCEFKLFYKENGPTDAIRSVLSEDYRLGIIRYPAHFDRYYKTMLDEKALNYELVAEFKYRLLVSRDSPLAKLRSVSFADLSDKIEIAHADSSAGSLPLSEVKKAELPDDIRRRICVFERASQFELLSENPETFMWVSPVSEKLLERYGLVLLDCGENTKLYKDVMIYRSDYRLTEPDKLFISELCRAKREIFR